ncbi:metal-dependent hydrolase [Nocardia seriolae]|uniref:Metal-dependent hydrolase n=1 Tax=Nocardia seriolae TaxID=37332 RepID=A0ABC9Z0N5_9NOCA|nr:metal-dependent hydrolase [Nocardia seriolae]BEK93577.1 metal-dependent hydrolase [Nocardia seriolae]GAM49129.1 metal-dependent hydrolase [Nocardia seriolae]GAP31086.1 metal-dependent hydrolase [Nocardia seriolae]
MAIGRQENTSLMPYPKVRRMRFRFGEPEPMAHQFVQGDIPLTHLIAVLSGAFPPGEESFIRSVRKFSDEVTDPVLKKRVAGFIGQAAVHGQQHRRLNEQLIANGFPIVRLFTFGHGALRERGVMAVENLVPRQVHLAFTAAAEHYTATLANRVLGTKEIQDIPGDAEVWNLLNWHAFEELEHKSVAFDVYRATGGPELVRIGVMAGMYFVTIPIVSAGVLASILSDPRSWRPLKVARQSIRLYRGPIVRGLLKEMRPYMRPGFHPDDIDTNALLEQWRQELFGADGELLDRIG